MARRLPTLASFYKYCEQEQLVDRNPHSTSVGPKVDDESRTLGLDRNQLGAFLVQAGLGLPGDHDLASVLARNGLRISEALGAETLRRASTLPQLNSGGDGQANAARWHIVFTRMAPDPKTQCYVERRCKAGSPKTEAMRCLLRYVARSSLLSPGPAAGRSTTLGTSLSVTRSARERRLSFTPSTPGESATAADEGRVNA